jgi:hypothetical protein
VTLPDEIVLDRSNRVTLHLETSQPYLVHERTRARYPSVAQTAPPVVLPSRYSFLFYPQHSVYLDPVRHRYYWFENGRWEQHERPPHSLVANPEAPQSVQLTTPTPETPPASIPD